MMEYYQRNCKLLFHISSRQIFIKIVIESLWSLEPAQQAMKRTSRERLYAVPRRLSYSYESGVGGIKIS